MVLVEYPVCQKFNPVLQQKLEAQAEAWRGGKGGLLWAVAKETGDRLAEYKLDSPPVFDGMIAAQGRLYLALMDGTIVCYENEQHLGDTMRDRGD